MATALSTTFSKSLSLEPKSSYLGPTSYNLSLTKTTTTPLNLIITRAKSSKYNVQVVVEENEGEDSILKRFKRQVKDAGIIDESKARRFFETPKQRKLRKAKDFARRNKKRRFQPKPKEKPKEADNDDDDNWEYVETILPYG
ncbi:hypothetical protein ACFE04_028357 [Oxalis oulophora]